MPDWYSQPPLIVAIMFVLIGFVVLLKGADVLVQGAVVCAKRFGLTTAVIGATVVAFGTSLPELMVSVFSNVMAAREGTGGNPDGPAAIAIANVIGSNIFNIAMVLGVAAIMRNLPVPRTSLRIDLPLMFLSFVVLFLFCLPWSGGDSVIGRVEGAVFFLALIGYTFLSIKLGKADPDDLDEFNDEAASIGHSIFLIVVGIILLVLGGELTLNGGVNVARAFDMSERVIGLTVMAIGTSLPELATSVQAVRKGETDIAIANILGSNCFNILSILGISALIVPLPVNAGILYWDFWWMLGLCCLVLPAMVLRHAIGKGTGIILIVGLLIYMSLLVLMPDLGMPNS